MEDMRRSVGRLINDATTLAQMVMVFVIAAREGGMGCQRDGNGNVSTDRGGAHIVMGI
jgi:hypothetical protein